MTKEQMELNDEGNISELIETYLYQYIHCGENNKRTSIDGLPREYPAYTMVSDGEIGVIIPYDGTFKVDERFEGCRLRDTNYAELGRCLILTTKFQDEELISLFSPICAKFVTTDENGEKREKIVSNPFEWIEKVSKIWGNAKKKKKPSAILAELYSLHMAYRKGIAPVWEGPTGTLVDIRGKTIDIEVKSSTSVDNTEITISRELQLDKGDNELHLYYVCLQRTESGLSINDMVDKLVKEDGFDVDDLEEKLFYQGFQKGKSDRMVKYLVTKMWDFVIDDDFPKITPDSFKNGKMPKFITKIEYTIDISGLDYKNMLE